MTSHLSALQGKQFYRAANTILAWLDSQIGVTESGELKILLTSAEIWISVVLCSLRSIHSSHHRASEPLPSFVEFPELR